MKSGRHALITNIEQLRERCVVNSVTHCWLWQGAMSDGRTPVLYGFDHERGIKRPMSAGKAVWNLAHGEAPPKSRPLVIRACGTTACVNPAHLRAVAGPKEAGEHIARAGWRLGTHLEQRRANWEKALAAWGVRRVPDAVFEAVRASGEKSLAAVAAEHGVSTSFVSKVRRSAAGLGLARMSRGADGAGGKQP